MDLNTKSRINVIYYASTFLTAITLSFYFHAKSQFRELNDKLDRSKVELQSRDLNNNGISDKFYVIDGKIAVVELDGKPIVSTLEKQLLEKE